MSGANWTAEEVERIRALREDGVRYGTLAAHLHLFPGRTLAALRQQYAKLFTSHGSQPRLHVRRTENSRDIKRAMRARPVAHAREDHDELLRHPRPKVRADCLPGGCNEVRPCPFVSCKHHLYLEVSEDTGSITVAHANKEPWELADTCALDVAERGQERALDLGAEHTLDELGGALNLTRERVRQLVEGAVARAAESLSPREAQRVREALETLDASDREDRAEPVAPSIPRVVRHLPVVQDRPAPVRATLDPEARALAATFASMTSPRTWLRRAAARRAG